MNDLFGNINWKDADIYKKVPPKPYPSQTFIVRCGREPSLAPAVPVIRKVIAEEIPGKVAADTAYKNAMKNSDKQNARIEHDNALGLVMVELIADHTELFKQFSDNPLFKKWLGDTIFGFTYSQDDTQLEKV